MFRSIASVLGCLVLLIVGTAIGQAQDEVVVLDPTAETTKTQTVL